MIGLLDIYNSSNSNNIGKYASGGILNETSKDIINGGFTISQFNNILNEYFPYSFGFKVFKKKNTNQYRGLMADYDDAPSSIYGYNDSQIGSKLFFPQYKRDHEINFEIHQGGENTYFDFLINDKNGNYWIGIFGFKDRGDVSSDYITGFIALLMECYGLPFSIKHTVYDSGGNIPLSKPTNVGLTNMLSPFVSIDTPNEIHTKKFYKALEYLILNKGYKTSDILLQTNFVTTDEVEKELRNDFRKYKNQVALSRDMKN
jgi:hypothetical protein